MTRNEASYREKGRSLFLAALMVMSVFAMSAAFAGSAAANHNEFDNANDLDDQDIYIGEDLVVTDNVSDSWYELHQGTSPGNKVDDIRTDSGTLTYDTSDLEEGPYVITDTDQTMIHDEPFVMQEMNLDAEFDPQSAEEDTDALENVDLTVDFNEDVDTERHYDLTIVETSGELDEGDLENIFGSENVNDDGEVKVTVQDNAGDQTIAANFSTIDIGEYEFEVTSDDTGASDSATFEVAEDLEANIEFVESTMQDTQGDVAEIVLDVENAEQAYIELEEDYDVDPFTANFNISVDEDLEDDEYVTVKFNTYNAGNNDSTDAHVVEVENGEVLDYEESDFDGRLPAHSYDLTVFEQASDQVREDAGILTLSEPSVGDATTSIAPGAIDGTDAEEIVDAKSDLDNVADGDYAIVEVEATGIYGYWAEEGEFNNSDELNVTLDTVATDRSGEPRESLTDYEVVPDAENDRFFVVVDASDLSDEAYDDWTVTFTANADYPYFGDEEQSVSSTFTVEERDLKFDINSGEQYQVTMDGDNAWEVRGSSTALAPGTEVTVTASSSLFLESETVEIQADSDGDRYFVVNFADDINDEEVELGHEFSLTAEVADHDDVDVTGVVSEVPEWETSASAEELEQLLEDYEVDSVQDLRDLIDSLKEDREALALLLEENDAEDVEDLQAQIDELENDSEDLNALLEENDVEDAEGLQTLIDDLNEEVETLESENADLQEDSDALNQLLEDNEVENADELQNYIDELEENQKKDDSNEEEEEEETSDDDDSSEEDDGTPGFGVAVAAVALLAAAMLALRRQH